MARHLACTFPRRIARGLHRIRFPRRWAISGGITPDLRASGVVLSETGFSDVVRGGSRVPMGMPAYRAITDDELLALRHFIRQRAEAALAQPKK